MPWRCAARAAAQSAARGAVRFRIVRMGVVPRDAKQHRRHAEGERPTSRAAHASPRRNPCPWRERHRLPVEATGRSPNRRPNCSIAQVSSGRGHLQSSSHQAAENCGPRSAGSSAEKSWARAHRRPGHPPLRRLVMRTGVRRMHREQTRHAFDHHGAGIGKRLANQRDTWGRDAVRRGTREAANPLGSGPRLAGATALPSIGQVVQASPPCARLGGNWSSRAQSSKST